MDLAEKMSESIAEPDDFGKNLNGMTIFRACSMSIQCITENFIKVRNNTKTGFFTRYKTIFFTVMVAYMNMTNILVQFFSK